MAKSDETSTPSNTDTDEESSTDSESSSSESGTETTSRSGTTHTKEGASSSTGYSTTASTRTGTASSPSEGGRVLATGPPPAAQSTTVRRSVSFATEAGPAQPQHPPKSSSSPSKSSKSTSSSGSGGTSTTGTTETETDSSDEESDESSSEGDSDDESSASGTSTSVSVSASTESRSTAASGSKRGSKAAGAPQTVILAPPQGRIPTPPARPPPEQPKPSVAVARPAAIPPSAKPSTSTDSSTSSSSGSDDSSESSSGSSATSTATGTTTSRSTAPKSSAPKSSTSASGQEKVHKERAGQAQAPNQPQLAQGVKTVVVSEEPVLERRASRRLSKAEESDPGAAVRDSLGRQAAKVPVSPSLAATHPDDIVRTEDDANTPPPSVKGSHDLSGTGRPGKNPSPTAPPSRVFDTPPPEPAAQHDSAPLIPLVGVSEPDQPKSLPSTAAVVPKPQPTSTASTPTVVTVHVPKKGDPKAKPHVKPGDTTGPLRYSTSVRESVDSSDTTSSAISKSTESSESSSAPAPSKSVAFQEPRSIEPASKAKPPETSEPTERTVRRVVRERLEVDYTEPAQTVSPLPDACFIVPDEANLVKRCWETLRGARGGAIAKQDTAAFTVNKREFGAALRSIGLTEHQVATLTLTTPSETDNGKFVEALEYQIRALFRTGLEALFAAHDPTNTGELSWTSTMRVLSVSGIATAKIADEVSIALLPTKVTRSSSVEVRFSSALTQQQPAVISLDQMPLDVSVGDDRTVVVQGSPLCTLTSTARCEQLVTSLRIAGFIARVCRDAVFPGEALVDYRRVLDTLCGPSLGSKPHLLAHRFVDCRYRPLARLAMLVESDASPASLPVRYKGIEHSFLAECYTSPSLRKTYVAPEADKTGTAFLGGAPPPPPSAPTAAGLATAGAVPVAWCIRLVELSLPAAVLKGLPPDDDGQRFVLITIIDKANKVLPCVRVSCTRSKQSRLEWSIEPQDREIVVRGGPEDVLYCEFCYEPRDKGAVPKGAETIGILSCGFATAQLRDLELGQSHLWVNAGTFWRRLPSKETSVKSCLCITGPPLSRLTVETTANFPSELDFFVFPPRFVVSARHIAFLRFFRKAVHDHCAVSHNCQMALSTGAALQAMAVVEQPELFDCLCDRWAAELRAMTPAQRADTNGFATQRLLQRLSVGLAAWAASGGRREVVDAVLSGNRIVPPRAGVAHPQAQAQAAPPVAASG